MILAQLPVGASTGDYLAPLAEPALAILLIVAVALLARWVVILPRRR